MSKKRRVTEIALAGPQTLNIAGEAVPVTIRINPRAQRHLIKVEPSNRSVVLVTPSRYTVESALEFAMQNRDWIAEEVAAVPRGKPFKPGRTIPYLGDKLKIVHRPYARRGVWIDGDKLNVSGALEHVDRRVKDFLKTRAREELAECAYEHARRARVKIARLAVRDTTTRWGSCSCSGTLSFSWRLVLAPYWVLDYVAAHEVAHLRHLDHSDRFWNLVDRLIPWADEGEEWLEDHGALLYAYGREG
jgi:predicted metal-dependent hydrolase